MRTLALTLLLVVLGLAAAEPGGGTIAGVRERGRLVVAQVAGERFPFFFLGADGTRTGSDIDLAQAMAEALGVELELDATAATFDEAVERVSTGRADMAVSKLSVSLARAARVRFSRPYLVQREALLVNRLRLAADYAGQDAQQAWQMPGAPLGVVRGTSFARSLPSLAPRARVSEYDDPAALAAATVRGSVLAAYHDEITFTLLRRLRPQLVLWTEQVLLRERADQLAIALPAGDPHLAAWTDLLLETRGGPTTPEALLTRWLAGPASGAAVVGAQAAALDRAMAEAGAAAVPAAQPRRWGALAVLAAALALLAAGAVAGASWLGRSADGE